MLYVYVLYRDLIALCRIGRIFAPKLPPIIHIPYKWLDMSCLIENKNNICTKIEK